MVHALEEIRRTLVLEGVLIDLRPLLDNWPVEVVSDRACREIGRLKDLPSGLADDEAANNAIKVAALKDWFIRDSEQIFPFFDYWNTPEEMRDDIQEKWPDFIQLEKHTFSAAKAAWATTGANRRIRVRLKMLLTRWRKR
jgi:hypothetical protein